MSPFVRGRAIAQVESSGRTKKSFDVLLWTEELLYKGFRQLDAIQQLREYLSTIFPQPVSINLWLPEGFTKAHTLNPLADTEYNFSKFHTFPDKVLNSCSKSLTAP
jgi:hypothetical protein